MFSKFVNTSPQKSLSQTAEILLVLSLVIIQSISIVTLREYLLVEAGIILAIAFALFILTSITRLYFLLALYISIFAIQGYLVYFPGFTLSYTILISLPLFMLLLTYWLIYLTREKELFTLNQMDIAIVFFLGVALIATANGLLRNYNKSLVLSDAVPLVFTLGYFVFLYSPLRRKIESFYLLLFIASIFVSLHFIYAAASFRILFFLQRIVSRHIHLTQFAIPLAMTILIYSPSRKRKIVCSFALPLFLVAVILSQQRALYGSVGLTVLFLIGLFIYTRRAWIGGNRGMFIMYAAFTCILITALLLAVQILSKGRFLPTLFFRLSIFLNPNLLSRDISWAIRWGEINNAMKSLGQEWILGVGLGASRVTRYRFVTQATLDNSYAFLLWKTGIIGLVAFLYMYAVFFIRGLKTLKKNISTDHRIIVTTALVNAAGLMIVAMTNSSIAHYRFIFVWMSLVACTEVITRHYETCLVE